MPQLHRRADAAPRRRHGALTKKNLLITAAIALGGLLVALCVFLVAVRPLAAQPTQKGALGTTTKGTTPALQPGEGVEQVLYWPDILAGFSVRVGTAGQTLPKPDGFRPLLLIYEYKDITVMVSYMEANYGVSAHAGFVPLQIVEVLDGFGV